MPRIPFTIRSLPFVTASGVAVPARRPFLTAQFVGAGGRRIPYPTFLDTGSAYSVIPYRLAIQVAWKDLGAFTFLGGRKYPVEWNGIPCQIGELELELVDIRAAVRTQTLRVLAKIACQPAAPHLEQAALLGMCFLADNKMQQTLDATGTSLTGFVWVA